jgi:hypothetical protein
MNGSRRLCPDSDPIVYPVALDNGFSVAGVIRPEDLFELVAPRGIFGIGQDNPKRRIVLSANSL